MQLSVENDTWHYLLRLQPFLVDEVGVHLPTTSQSEHFSFPDGNRCFLYQQKIRRTQELIFWANVVNYQFAFHFHLISSIITATSYSEPSPSNRHIYYLVWLALYQVSPWQNILYFSPLGLSFSACLCAAVSFIGYICYIWYIGYIFLFRRL